MILRLFIAFLIHFSVEVTTEYCGNNKIPYGLEVHRDGHLTLLCSRPNCHEKKYAECEDRPSSDSCPQNTTWVGGLEKTVDGQLFLQCCEYDLMETYGRKMFDNVRIRRGEFYEGEEKFDSGDEDVVAFDMISNIQRDTDEKGEFYLLTVHRFFCGKVPDLPPAWFRERQWPFFDNDRLFDFGK